MALYIETIEDFKTNIEQKDILVVCYFTAEWCGPCKSIAKFVDEVASHEKIKEKLIVLKIDVDVMNDLSVEMGVKCMPTFQFYVNKEKKDEITGANKENLVKSIKKNILNAI